MKKPRRGYHCVALLWTLLLVAFHAPVRADTMSIGDFWDLSAFLAEHPAQRTLTEAFAERVKAPAIPIDNAHKPVRIAVVYPGIQASDYWSRSVKSLEARLQDLNVSYVLDSHFTRPGIEVRKQAQLIAEAIRKDPDYLVFTLDTHHHRLIIEHLIARGRPKVILQNITTPMRNWGSSQPFLYAGFDHENGTQLLSRLILSGPSAPENIAILYGPRGYVSRARGDTFRTAAVANDTTRIVGSYYVGFDRTRAREATFALLNRHPKVDFIYACGTDIALGAVDALRERGLSGQVRVNGWGGGSVELDLIRQSALDATVMRMNDDSSVAIAEAIALDVLGRHEEVPLVFSGEFEVITPDLSETDLDALKARAFRYSQ